MTKFNFTLIPDLSQRRTTVTATPVAVPNQFGMQPPMGMSGMVPQGYYAAPYYGMGMPNAQPYIAPPVFRSATIRDRGLVVERIDDTQMANIAMMYFVCQPWADEDFASPKDVINAAAEWCKELLYAMRDYAVQCSDSIAPGLRLSGVSWRIKSYFVSLHVNDDEGSSVVGCGISTSIVYRTPTLGEVIDVVADRVLESLTQKRFFEVYYPGHDAIEPFDYSVLEERWKAKWKEDITSDILANAGHCGPMFADATDAAYGASFTDNDGRINIVTSTNNRAPDKQVLFSDAWGTPDVNDRVSVGTRSKEEQSDNPDDWESVQNSKKLMAKLHAEEPQVLPDSLTQD